MKKKIGFIGSGKMAQAMMNGIIQSKLVNPEDIIASAKTEETLDYVKRNFEVNVTLDNNVVAQEADYLFLAVKPYYYSTVIEEIREYISEHTVVITIAAGVTIQSIEESFRRDVKVVRSMPNTPSLVGEGMTAYCINHHLSEEEAKYVHEIFASFGSVELVNESLMDAVPAISGSSPAYVYMFIEALADGGVKQGFTRKQAYTFAAQAVLGAAKMVLETGTHPAELKDNVCTPGGTTIAAVAELERNHFRAAILEAMESCTKKSVELANKK